MGFWLLRQRTPTQRMEIVASMTQNARRFSLMCLCQQFSHFSQQALARKIAEAWLQEDCPPNYIPTGNKMTWIQDSLALAEKLHPILQVQGVLYYVTGGVAAITYGEPRTTRDLDLVIAIGRGGIPGLVNDLENAGFYVPGVEDVVSGRMKMLQITEMATISRADLVIAGEKEFDQVQFTRRQQHQTPSGAEIYMASPEDIILNKLLWGKQSQSEKQWRDILGVLKTQQDALDFRYLNQWASQFNLLQDLDRALLESGLW